jgi:membrane-associated phospholipid phosphatase
MVPIAYTIGKYAPLIMFLFTVVYVQPNHSIIYVLFCIVSFASNKILKSYYAEHRPSKKITGFGMPSNHAQSIAFSITFLFLITQSYLVLFCSTILAMLTMYQRVTSRHHSVQQVVAGSMLGIIFGFTAFHAT